MSTIYKPFISSKRHSDFDTTPLSLSINEIDNLLGNFPGVVQSNPSPTPSVSSNPGTVAPDEQKANLTQMRTLLNTKGEHQYVDSNIKVGNLDGFLTKAAECGISFRITSGERPGAVTSSGNRSRHDGGSAIDITPVEGETYEELYEKIRNSPLLDYMIEHNIGFLEERTKSDQKLYGATGVNIHISIPDESRPYGEKAAIRSRKKILGA